MTAQDRNLAPTCNEYAGHMGRRSGIDAPISEARGLPNTAFNSQSFYEIEQKQLFARSWVFAGRKSEVPNPGDMVPTDVAGQPAIIVKTASDQIRVFYNVCPHRGARLVSSPCRGRHSIVCPYHAWTYRLDGTLQARPHYFGPGNHETEPSDPSADRPRLFPMRSATWHDWIFVNLDGQAPEFEELIAPAQRHWANFDLSNLRFGGYRQIDFSANWKLVIENYFDFYHVFKVHPKFHRSLSDTLRQTTVREGYLLHNFFCEEDEHPFVTSKGSEQELPPITGSIDSGLRKSVFGVLFPNTAVNIHPFDLQFSHFEPLGPDHTRLHRLFYFAADGATAAEHEPARERLIEAWSHLIREDVEICESAQKGRLCNAYDGGRFAPAWDAGAQEFHKMVADTILPESKEGDLSR